MKGNSFENVLQNNIPLFQHSIVPFSRIPVFRIPVIKSLIMILLGSSFTRGGLVVLFYAGLALLRIGPALFAGSDTAAALGTPDLWMHLWAFWRAGFALGGQDAGYMTSHLLTFPAVVREPIALCDPLLPLLAAAFQAFAPALPLIFNLLTLCGLVFTGFAGYLLAAHLTKSRPAGLVAGAILAFNPFLHRLLGGAFIEFAWCGLIPLTLWFLLCHAGAGRASLFAGYLVSLLALFLMSIYCAAYYTLLAAMVTLAAIVKARGRGELRPGLRRMIVLQVAAIAFLLPLFALWLATLSSTGFKEAPFGRPFVVPAQHAVALPDAPLTPEARDAPPLPLPPHARPERPMPMDQSAINRWITLYTSVDLGDLVSLTGEADPRPLGGAFNPAGLQSRVHAVFLREWLPVLALAGFAFGAGPVRRKAWGWAGLFAMFFALALGPFPIVNGSVLPGPALPYAWLYQWLPGFSRFYIPGRAFLGVALCLAMLAAMGAAWLFARPGLASAPRRQLLIAIAAALLCVAFPAWVGSTSFAMPATRVTTPAPYGMLARESGNFGLLELPVAPDIYLRTFFQTVHRKPIFKGAIPAFMVSDYGADILLANPLVRLFNEPPAGPEEQPSPATLLDASGRLRAMGFRYLAFHPNALPDPGRADSVLAISRDLFGPPLAESDGVLLWRLPGE